jgi:hypothetical protein
VIIGAWGDDGANDRRQGVSLIYGAEFGFSVIDAGGRPFDNGGLFGRALKREEVIGTPLAARFFKIIDAIWLQDERIADITLPDDS